MLPGSAWAAASIQPGRKYRLFVAPGPDGHRDTPCKAEVLHLGNCSAACALCTPPPCQCPGRKAKAGLSKRPWLCQPTAKTSDHSLGLIPAAAGLLSGARRGIHRGSVLPVGPSAAGASRREVSRAHQLHVSSGGMPGGLQINQPLLLLFLTFRAHC